MSGGHFDYKEYEFDQIAESIKHVISVNHKEQGDKTYSYKTEFSNETIKEMKKAVELMRKARVYATRIDYLLSSDDGEDTFHERLKEDLKKL